MHYEEVLLAVYGNGTFQIILTIFCALASLGTAIELQSLIFLHITPQFACDDADLQAFEEITWISKSNYQLLLSGNYSKIPKGIRPVSEQCWAGVRQLNSSQNIIGFACESWNFSSEPMARTLVTDFNMVCDREKLETWLISSIILASALGHAMAIFTDRFSRRKVLIFYCIWEIVTMCAVPLLNSPLPLVYVVRILRMFSSPMFYLAPCLIQEILPTGKRAIFSNLYWLPFGFGYMAWTGVAYLAKDWFIFRLYSLIPLIFYLPIPFISPESPRWLMLHGTAEEFVNEIRRIAKWNRVQMPESFYEEIASLPQSTQQKEEEEKAEITDSPLDVIRYPNMRIKTICLSFAHSAITLCYFGLTTSADFSTDNVFLNVFFQGLSEIPSALIGWLLSARMGRRPCFIFLLLLTGITVSCAPAIKRVQPIVSTIVSLTGRIAVTTTYCISDLYTTEIFPTTIRNLGIYLTVTCGGLVGAIAPLVNRLKWVAFYLPGLIYGGICTISALLVYLYLPETRFCPLTQTISECEELVRGNEKQWTRKMEIVFEAE